MDEFAVLAPGVPDAAAAGQLAGNLLAGLADPFVIDDLAFTLDASVGVTVLDDGPTDPGGLLAAADMALQRARRTGTGWAL